MVRGRSGRAIGTWRQLQEDLQAYTSDPMSVDDPEAYLAEYVYPSPSWNNFHRVRSLRSQQRPSYLRRKKKRDKTRYKTTLKAQRSTPETRDKLKLRKREERARKRLATERAEEQALASVLGNV